VVARKTKIGEKMTKTNELTLSDTAIGHIAKALQVSMLTGTDVVDNLRLMRFNLTENVLDPTEEYITNFDKNINDMLQEAIDYMNAVESGEIEIDYDDDDEDDDDYESGLDDDPVTDSKIDLAEVAKEEEIDVEDW
jgi:hypothetical protein